MKPPRERTEPQWLWRYVMIRSACLRLNGRTLKKYWLTSRGSFASSSEMQPSGPSLGLGDRRRGFGWTTNGTRTRPPTRQGCQASLLVPLSAGYARWDHTEPGSPRNGREPGHDQVNLVGVRSLDSIAGLRRPAMENKTMLTEDSMPRHTSGNYRWLATSASASRVKTRAGPDTTSLIGHRNGPGRFCSAGFHREPQRRPPPGPGAVHDWVAHRRSARPDAGLRSSDRCGISQANGSATGPDPTGRVRSSVLLWETSFRSLRERKLQGSRLLRWNTNGCVGAAQSCPARAGFLLSES